MPDSVCVQAAPYIKAASLFLPYVKAGIFTFLLLAASVVDIRRREIPDLLCALVLLTCLIQFEPVRLVGIFAALPLLIAAICKEKSFGGGDIKLIAAAGAVIGFEAGMHSLVLSLGALLLYHLLVRCKAASSGKKEDKNAAYPLAPFLCLGFSGVYISAM